MFCSREPPPSLLPPQTLQLDSAPCLIVIQCLPYTRMSGTELTPPRPLPFVFSFREMAPPPIPTQIPKQEPKGRPRPPLPFTTTPTPPLLLGFSSSILASPLHPQASSLLPAAAFPFQPILLTASHIPPLPVAFSLRADTPDQGLGGSV